MNLVVILAFLAVQASAASLTCPKLSVTDAHVLTQKQLAARVCAYMENSKAVKELKAGTELMRLQGALDCIYSAAEVENLYRERFNGKRTGCITLDSDNAPTK